MAQTGGVIEAKVKPFKFWPVHPRRGVALSLVNGVKRYEGVVQLSTYFIILYDCGHRKFERVI